MGKSDLVERKWWVRRHPILAVFSTLFMLGLAVICFLAWLSYELFHNFVCDDWRPGMTKEEKIMLAIEIANKRPELTFEFIDPEGSGKTYLGTAKQIPYSDVSSILKESPNCCKIIESRFYDASEIDELDHASEDLFYNDEGTVLLRYLGRYIGSDKKVHSAKVFWYTDLNRCKKK